MPRVKFEDKFIAYCNGLTELIDQARKDLDDDQLDTIASDLDDLAEKARVKMQEIEDIMTKGEE
jgi:hypothetical protein